MKFSANWFCWEIMDCNVVDCPARIEPETPCWEIVERFEDFRHQTDSCTECLVYILKKGAFTISPRNLKKILARKGYFQDEKIGCQSCYLKLSSSTGQQ